MAAPGMSYTKVTCVHYERDDTLGKALAHASLAPVLLICAQVAKVYCRREVHEGFFLLGMLASEAVARGLKHLMRSPRPGASCARLGVCDAHGMPSSHTTLAFAYLALSAAAAAAAVARMRPAARVLAVAEVCGAATAAGLVAASRVYLGYHSQEQVAAGAALGLVLGLLWHALMRAAGAAGSYSALASWGPAAALGAKDTWGCAEPLLVEQQADYRGGRGQGGGGGGGAGSRPRPQPRPGAGRNWAE